MMEINKIAKIKRVDRGIEWLNTKDKYWISKIDIRKLDMSSWKNCILGQVFRESASTLTTVDEDYAYGFKSDAIEKRDEDLKEIWIHKINEISTDQSIRQDTGT